MSVCMEGGGASFLFLQFLPFLSLLLTDIGCFCHDVQIFERMEFRWQWSHL